MGATASQCCTACNESQHEIVEADPHASRRSANGGYLRAEAAVPQVPGRAAPSGPGRNVAAAVATEGGFVRHSPPLAGADLSASFGGRIEKSSDGSTNKARPQSEATLTPSSGPGPRRDAALAAAEAQEENTEDLTEEPTLPPREEEILESPLYAAAAAAAPAEAAAELPAAGEVAEAGPRSLPCATEETAELPTAATAAAPADAAAAPVDAAAAEPPAAVGEANPALPTEAAAELRAAEVSPAPPAEEAAPEQDAEASPATPAEAGVEPAAEASPPTPAEAAPERAPQDCSAEPAEAAAEPPQEESGKDPLQQAIDGGECKLQTGFESPRKSSVQEPATPPTAVPGSPAEPAEPAELEPEPWGDFLERAGGRLREAGVADEAAALFDVFQTTDDLGLTYASFARLYAMAAERVPDVGADAGQPPWAAPAEASGRTWRYPYQLFQRLLGSQWRAQKLWKLLNERTGRPEYAEASCSRGRLKGRHCLVVGAGPCGLRAAIELRLLGAQVTVVEQRVRFTRINQLHIWSWCGEDLKGLGARIIEPPPKDFGSNPDLLVIAINDLQKLLLKVALLLGADVRLGLSYGGVRREAGGWRAELGVASPSLGAEGRAGAETPASPLASFAAPGGLPPSPFSPGPIPNLAVVLGSGGFASAVGDEVGMRMLETDSLRKESAIGLICNVARTNGKAEAGLRSFSMARQFYMAKFKQAAEETGADLENIVYVKAPTAHYFVMTPTPKSLVRTGVVIDKTRQPMLQRDNISSEKLDALVRRVLSYRFKENEPTVMEAVGKDLGGEGGSFPGYADSGPRLFDFSKMRRSTEGLIFMPPSEGAAEEAEDANLLVALAGDALIEPFWPEGLGVVRGFFSVLDACYAVEQWSNGATCSATQEVYSAAFQKLKTLSAATRARVLREDERKFALAPCTRYR